MAASVRTLRSLFASIRNLFVVIPGPVVCLLVTMGVLCAPRAEARAVSVSYSGAYQVLGGPLTYPTDVAIDSSGNVYVAMPDLDAIEEIPASCIAGSNNGSCVTPLGSGFSQPFGVAVDAGGNVYVADSDNDAVKVILASCIAAKTSTSNPACVVPLGSGFSEPYGVAVDGSGNLYVADTFHSAVKMIASSCVAGAISPAEPVACTSAGSTVITTAHFFAIPIGIAADASGDIFVTDASGSDFTLTGTTHTNAGSYSSDTWSFSDPSGNYATASGSVSDSIGKATATVNVTPYSVTYDGNPHTATATATGVGGVSLSGSDVTLTGTTHTNAGSYTGDVWSFADPSGNYSSSSGAVTDSIAKATATVNVAAYSVTYDGNAHTATATATGVGGVSLSGSDFTLTGTTHTNAGSYSSDAWSFADASGNYAAASGAISDTIAQTSASIAVTPYDVTYNGNAHTATAIATGVGGVSLSGSDFTLTGTTHTNVGSYAGDSWNFSDSSGNYLSASGTVTDTINGASAAVTLGSLAQTYTGSPLSATATTVPTGLTVSFTYTGTDGTSYGPTSTPPTAAGSYIVQGAVSGTTDYSGSNSGVLVIAKAAAQVAIPTSTTNPAAPGSSVTLTATITPTAGTPTGTVTFMDNTGTTLGQGTVTSGVATLTFDFTDAQEGTNSITAVYSGDSNFVGASSSVLTETVMALSVSTGSGGVSTQTVSAGGLATYSLSITPTSGTSFPTALTLTVSGMPAGATATISPSTWTQLTGTSWSLPANTALSAITLSIQLPASTSRLDDGQGATGRRLPPVLWGVLLLPFAYRLRRAGKRMRRAISMVLLLAAGFAAAAALGGCGNGSGSSSSSTGQPSDYTITVTVSSDSVSSSTKLTLVVNE